MKITRVSVGKLFPGQRERYILPYVVCIYICMLQIVCKLLGYVDFIFVLCEAC